MLTDAHSHNVNEGEVNTIYNVRINDDPMSLPHGPRLYFSAGIHPRDAHNFQPAWLEKLNLLLNYQQVVAIGECGLDKTIETPFEVQLQVFERQLILSEIVCKPLILHCVGYFNELLQIKERHSPRQAWVIHGFRGKPELARQLLRKGVYLSYGEKFNPESVAATPPGRLLTETDESKAGIETIHQQILAHNNCRPEELTAAYELFKL